MGHTVGNNTYKAAIGQIDDTGSTSNSGADHFSLAFSRALSSSAEIYAQYVATSNDANAAYGINGTKGDTTGGKDVSAFSFGITKKFSSL